MGMLKPTIQLIFIWMTEDSAVWNTLVDWDQFTRSSSKQTGACHLPFSFPVFSLFLPYPLYC
jgi:hypothetical protein